MSNAERTYRGPIIEMWVEAGIVNGNEWRERKPAYVLAVDSGTGELVILLRLLQSRVRFVVSYYDPTHDPVVRKWKVTP